MRIGTPWSGPEARPRPGHQQMTLRRCPRPFCFTTRTALSSMRSSSSAKPRRSLWGRQRKRGTVDKSRIAQHPEAWLKEHQTTIWGSGVRISSGAP